MSFETLKNIAEGYGNLIKSKLDILPEDIEQLSEKRMEVCESCEDHYNHVFQSCRLCNCFMPAATKSINKKCPKGYW